MADFAVLNFNVREKVSKSENKVLMKNGYVLGNINNKGTESISIVLKRDEFRKTLKQYGRNAVLKLEGADNNSYHVMVKDIQTSLKDYDVHHVDFQQVQLTERVRADVALKYIGTEFLEPKRLILNRLMDSVPVTGLPQDIPEVIEFDVSKLEGGSNILIKDLAFQTDIKSELEDDQLLGSIIEAKGMDKDTTEEDGMVE